jgi:hypothetical protein
LGPTPWKDGHGDQVIRQDYVPGGVVAAAPGGGDWFHQHFGISREPLRFLFLAGLIRYGAFDPGTKPGEVKISRNLNIEEGGSSIGYPQEDPYIRAEWRHLATANGVDITMTDEMYQNK